MKTIEVKLSEDLYNQLEEYAQKNNKTKSDVIRQALIMFFGISEVADKQIKTTIAKITPALYSSRCKKCNRELSQGEIIGLIKIVYEDNSHKTFVYCLDCYYSLSDKTIVDLEVKKVKLQKTISAFKREINRLVNIYEELEREVKVMSNLKQVVDELKLYIEKVYQGENVDLKKLIQELSDLNMNISDLLRLVEVKKKIYAKYKTPQRTH